VERKKVIMKAGLLRKVKDRSKKTSINKENPREGLARGKPQTKKKGYNLGCQPPIILKVSATEEAGDTLQGAKEIIRCHLPGVHFPMSDTLRTDKP